MTVVPCSFRAFDHTVTVKIKYADFRQATRSRTVAGPITSQPVLREISVGLVRAVFPVKDGIRLVDVALSNFRGDDPSQQLDLGLISAPS